MLSGRCACKTVTYRAEDSFVVAYNCHCSNCRALTGSAFLPWGEVEPTKLSVTGGTDSLHVDGDADAIHAMRVRAVLVPRVLDRPPSRPHPAPRALRDFE